MGLVLLVPYFFGIAWIVWFLLAGIIHHSSPDLGLRKDYTCQPTVSVILSCYNEGEAVYKTIESACQSNYPQDKFEVIVFDDCSTDGQSWQWIKRAEADFPNVRAYRNAVNRGKGKTVAAAIDMSQAEIILTIDSDVLLDVDAIRELMACFHEPKIALVGGVVGISNPNENALTAFQVHIYYLFFRLAKIPEIYFHSVACVSGCLSAMRREVFLQIKPKVEARNWFGVPIKYGEDRYITHQTLLHGHSTYLSMQAKCWTNVPNTYAAYWGQQLRWRRSGFADFITTVRQLPENLKVVPIAALYTYFINPLSIFMLVGWVFSLPFTGTMIEALATRALYYVGLSCFAIWAINRWHLEQKVTINPLRIIGVGAWWLVRNLFMTPLTLMTLDSDGWGGARDLVEEVKGEL